MYAFSITDRLMLLLITSPESPLSFGLFKFTHVIFELIKVKSGTDSTILLT